MPFIGKQPEVGAYQLIDSITTSATDTYALTVDGSAYFPASARNLIVSLNGVTQAPESAYTVSGSNIVFDSALTASDVIDYIMVIGDAVDIGTPSDGTVGNAQLKSDLDFSGKTLTFSNDQISGDAISGGTATLDGLTVDTNTLYVDSTNNRVGIGESSPEAPLHISNGGIQLADQSQIGLDLYHTVSSIPSSQNHGYIATANNLAGGVNGDLLIAPRTSAGASIRFITGASPSEKVRIDSNGNLQVTGTLGNATLESNGAVLEFSRNGANYIAARGGSSSIFIFQTGGAVERMRLDSSGNFLVGNPTVPNISTGTGNNGFGVDQNGRVIQSYSGNNVANYCNKTDYSSGTTYFHAFRVEGTTIGTIGSANGTSTFYNTGSDYRLKENVVSLDNATDRLKQLSVHRFNFIADPSTTVDGFLAHEVQSVVPEAITGDKDEVDDEGNPVYQGIDQSKLVPLLTAAIQEQQTIIEDLQTRLSALEAN